mgnify:CR=1 FL=1
MLGFFVVVFVVIIITMIALGKEYHYEKSITINAPIEKVWQNVNSMKAINSWSPFMKLDPNMKETYSGASGTVGELYTWSGNDKAGQGEERIIQLVPNEKAVVDIHFIKPFESNASGIILLKPQGTSTEVTWAFDTTMEYPSNLMKLFLQKGMDDAFGDGLNSLKAMSERP